VVTLHIGGRNAIAIL